MYSKKAIWAFVLAIINILAALSFKYLMYAASNNIDNLLSNLLYLGQYVLMILVFAGYPALVLGVWALVNISQSKGNLEGKVLAISAIVLFVISYFI